MLRNPSIQGAGYCLAAANMSVTVAVEEARKRGALSPRDCENLTHAETDQYMDLARREWGVTTWDHSDARPERRPRREE